jgi:tRNA(Ile)-lysidine synthase
MNMLNNFLSFLKKEQLFPSSQPILLAVSGGMDSVAMADVCHKANITFGIAHCNFQLRGTMSDEDEDFVRKLAQQYQVPFFVTHFDTISYAATHKLSIQVAARELRYRWFEEVRQANHFIATATAHHLNDSIETSLYNLARGTGIAGIRGILPKKNTIIRPLLFATREEISTYIQENKLSWREDASNADDKYRRNFIRHHIVPLFKELNPNLEQTFAQNFAHLRAMEQVWKEKIEAITIQYTRRTEKEYTIHTTFFTDLAHFPISAFLFELLRAYHFNIHQVENIIRATNGSVFYAGKYVLLKTHTQLIVKQSNESEPNTYYLVNATDDKVVFQGKKFSFAKQIMLPNFSANTLNTAYFNVKKLVFPLKIRCWQAGDSFKPFGMKGKTQKIQDFLTNKKLNTWEKSQVFILENGNQEIIWVVGHRIDERYKLIDAECFMVNVE